MSGKLVNLSITGIKKPLSLQATVLIINYMESKHQMASIHYDYLFADHHFTDEMLTTCSNFQEVSSLRHRAGIDFNFLTSGTKH